MIDPTDPTAAVLLKRLQDLAVELFTAGEEYASSPDAPIEEHLAGARRGVLRQLANLEEQLRILDSLLGSGN